MSTATAEVGAEQPRRRLPQIKLGRAGELLPLAVALIATLIVFRVGSEFFLTARNLTNLLVQMAPLALVAIASTLVIVMGEIDLSLGSIAGLAGPSARRARARRARMDGWMMDISRSWSRCGAGVSAAGGQDARPTSF